MPSNFTENYQLSQWEATDQVKREDFNADNAKIDAALGELTQERVCTGTYQGDGTNDHVIQLPWAPKIAFLMGRIFNDGALAILTPGMCYIIQDDFGASNNYGPLMEGDTIQIQHSSWFNNGVVEYVIFR